MLATSELTTHLEGQLDNYLADLRYLAAVDSGPNNREGANTVNDWLQARLEACGFNVVRHPYPDIGDGLVATRHGTGRGRIVLMGHTDTVYPDGTGVSRPLTTVGDKILGPGTCDMKAGLLVSLYALESLHRTGFTAFERITYLCVADEELAERATIPLISETVRGHDAALNLEAARENGDIVTARKGSMVVYITAHGRSAHSGVEPEKGRNAIMALVEKLPQVEALAAPDDGVTINIGVINGGRLPNIVPAQAQATLDVRAFNQHELDAIAAQIQTIFAAPDGRGVSFSTQIDVVSPAMPYTEGTVHLEALAQQSAQELGFEVKGAATGGAADAAFAAVEGVPVLDGLGPVGGSDHSPDEYILKSSIIPRTALLTRLITRICGDEHE